ncbi:MAG TPA: hypothetical protein VFA54_00535 [Bryobacterales bacterium]|jgi:hypothetical protein|nr:hypothetical protein [Bryobacterales bacterium]
MSRKINFLDAAVLAFFSSLFGAAVFLLRQIRHSSHAEHRQR